MHDSKRDRANGPKPPRDRSGPDDDVESEPKSAPNRRSVHDRTGTAHPVERVYGMLGNGAGTDELLEEIRGR